MVPVLVMSNIKIAVKFATFNLLNQQLKMHICHIWYFFARKFNIQYESEVRFFKFWLWHPIKKEPRSKDVRCCSKKSLPGQFFTVRYSTARVSCGLWNRMQRENRERNFNNTHRLKVGCVMHYSTVAWNPGFSIMFINDKGNMIIKDV